VLAEKIINRHINIAASAKPFIQNYQQPLPKKILDVNWHTNATQFMAKPSLASIPAFYHTYVKLVETDDLATALPDNAAETTAFLHRLPAEKWDYRYAEGKWTIKELIQHVIDTERIFSYRALCFARGEKISLPGFDENTYAAASEANNRTSEALLNEWKAVRSATQLLYQSFSEKQLLQTGMANNSTVSVEGLGFIIVGHVLHHLQILKERYLT
jgi:uncharacterized damage-inducible protein DinB